MPCAPFKGVVNDLPVNPCHELYREMVTIGLQISHWDRKEAPSRPGEESASGHGGIKEEVSEGY